MRQIRTEEGNALKPAEPTDTEIETKNLTGKQSDHVPPAYEQEQKAASQISSSPPALTPGTLQPESPMSKKRALEEPSAKEEPITKKAKENLADSPNGDSMTPNAVDIVNKETWQGFCEIESEPAYFSSILRDIGVQDVTVREVFAMTPDLLDMLPQPIYGLILLFRYREFGNEDQATDCPRDVWFANQLPAQNSCGTLAMINILMNNPDVQVGEHLTQFKDFTNDMTPFQRGEAFASFDFVKKIHNSFAKKMDLLENDKILSSKVKRAQRLKDPSTITTTTTTKKEKSTGTGTKSRPHRRGSADSTASHNSSESFEENGHHFIAFVPIGTQVWKLDGMDAQPTCVGTFAPEAGETWVDAASDTIATLMAAGDDDYGVVALTQSPLKALRGKAGLAINTLSHVESRLEILNPTWREFVDSDSALPGPRMLGIESILASHPVPATLQSQIKEEKLEDLLNRRVILVQEISDTAACIMEEVGTEAAEEEKARQRRFDSGPAIKVWLEMLAGNGWLEGNLKRFM
jgi:ubiquitin carboxyl-terminal hydrolase L5